MACSSDSAHIAGSPMARSRRDAVIQGLIEPWTVSLASPIQAMICTRDAGVEPETPGSGVGEVVRRRPAVRADPQPRPVLWSAGGPPRMQRCPCILERRGSRSNVWSTSRHRVLATNRPHREPGCAPSRGPDRPPGSCPPCASLRQSGRIDEHVQRLETPRRRSRSDRRSQGGEVGFRSSGGGHRMPRNVGTSTPTRSRGRVER